MIKMQQGEIIHQSVLWEKWLLKFVYQPCVAQLAPFDLPKWGGNGLENGWEHKNSPSHVTFPGISSAVALESRVVSCRSVEKPLLCGGILIKGKILEDLDFYSPH